MTGGSAKGERVVLLDANALLSAVRLHIDVAKALGDVAPGWKAAVPTCVLVELERLGDTRHASAARELARRFPEVPASGAGDRAILAAATMRPGRAVFTNDRRLRAALREAGVTVFFIRGRSKVEADGPV